MDRTTKEEGKVLLDALRLLNQSLPMGEIVGLIYYKITVRENVLESSTAKQQSHQVPVSSPGKVPDMVGMPSSSDFNTPTLRDMLTKPTY